MASLSPGAQAVYRFLVTSIVPTKQVTTYSEVSDATGVPVGEEGGVIGKVLGEVARACETHNLPPLTAIVVRADEKYDPSKRHGMPGVGYFVQQSENDAAFAEWGQKPTPAGFNKDAERWKLQKTVEVHQDAVWKCASWPEKL